jgi:hypothetical protein
MTRTLVGHFSDSRQAQAVVQELERSGFTAEDLSYVSSDGSGRFAQPSAGERLGSTGAVKGAAVGGVSGLLLGLGALAIPGIGPVVAAGQIAVALAGAGVGAAAGGLIGALTDLGISKPDADRWAQAVREGGTLVLVRVSDDCADRARSVIASHEPVDVAEHKPAVHESGGFDPSDPHSRAADYGDEGGSSQWGQRVLRPDRIADRTVSRDADPVSGSEWSKGGRGRG